MMLQITTQAVNKKTFYLPREFEAVESAVGLLVLHALLARLFPSSVTVCLSRCAFPTER